MTIAVLVGYTLSGMRPETRRKPVYRCGLKDQAGGCKADGCVISGTASSPLQGELGKLRMLLKSPLLKMKIIQG